MLYEVLYEDMKAVFKSLLLLHTEVQWLLQGTLLSDLLELQMEVSLIKNDQNSLLEDYLNDQE